ncbi:MAG: lamin tail domain-containing protein [candidate division Zixibacteria bacterium]|nr:lamin tail domain-containing protein [candidate division Zixibacteria bacterium]
MKRFVLLLSVLLCLGILPARAQIVLNEILANEPAAYTTLEWVELFYPGPGQVNLNGWKFAEDDDTTTFTTDIFIDSAGYLILTRKLVSPPGSPSFEARWGDSSGMWGDSPAENFPAVEVGMSLTNSSGSVILTSPTDSVHVFTWTQDAGDGRSWEKRDWQSGDDLSNWEICSLPEGSTPGKINSISPAENDLALDTLYILPASPTPASSFSIQAKVKNSGLSVSEGNSLLIFTDYNFNRQPDAGETIADLSIAPLNPGDAVLFSATASLPEGNYRVMAQIGPDDKPYNDLKSLDIKVGTALPDIIINEIMAAPDLNQNQTEWIELYNRSQNPVVLKNWTLADSQGEVVLTEDILELAAGEYLIIADDQNKFQLTYPDFSGSIVQPTGWQTLDNSGDEVILKDSLGFLLEQVSYPSQSGSGISWERIDADQPASDPSNWWRSVDPKGATPNAPNSVSVAYSSSIKLEISPNPFSPDGDGWEDQASISYIIPLGVEFTLKIFDRRGRLVRTLWDKQSAVSGQINWDGKSDSGDNLHSGVYILLAETIGDKRETKKEAIAIIKP